LGVLYNCDGANLKNRRIMMENTGKIYKPLVIALSILIAAGALSVWIIIYEAVLRGGCISVAGSGCGISDVIIPAYYILCLLPLILCLIFTIVAARKIKNGQVAPKNKKLVVASVIIMVFLIVFPVPARQLLLSVRDSAINRSNITVVWPDGYKCEIVGEFDAGTTCASNYPEAHPAYVGRLYGKYSIGVDVYFASTLADASEPKIFVYISRYFPNGTLSSSETDRYMNRNDEWICGRSSCQHKDKTLSGLDNTLGITVEAKDGVITISSSGRQ
jgi:hypothetical protein